MGLSENEAAEIPLNYGGILLGKWERFLQNAWIFFAELKSALRVPFDPQLPIEHREEKSTRFEGLFPIGLILSRLRAIGSSSRACPLQFSGIPAVPL